MPIYAQKKQPSGKGRRPSIQLPANLNTPPSLARRGSLHAIALRKLVLDLTGAFLKWVLYPSFKRLPVVQALPRVNR